MFRIRIYCVITGTLTAMTHGHLHNYYKQKDYQKDRWPLKYQHADFYAQNHFGATKMHFVQTQVVKAG